MANPGLDEVDDLWSDDGYTLDGGDQSLQAAVSELINEIEKDTATVTQIQKQHAKSHSVAYPGLDEILGMQSDDINMSDGALQIHQQDAKEHSTGVIRENAPTATINSNAVVLRVSTRTSRATLLSLPPEVIHRIFYLLSNPDWLAATCNHLFSIYNRTNLHHAYSNPTHRSKHFPDNGRFYKRACGCCSVSLIEFVRKPLFKPYFEARALCVEWTGGVRHRGLFEKVGAKVEDRGACPSAVRSLILDELRAEVAVWCTDCVRFALGVECVGLRVIAKCDVCRGADCGCRDPVGLKWLKCVGAKCSKALCGKCQFVHGLKVYSSRVDVGPKTTPGSYACRDCAKCANCGDTRSNLYIHTCTQNRGTNNSTQLLCRGCVRIAYGTDICSSCQDFQTCSMPTCSAWTRRLCAVCPRPTCVDHAPETYFACAGALLSKVLDGHMCKKVLCSGCVGSVPVCKECMDVGKQRGRELVEEYRETDEDEAPWKAMINAEEYNDAEYSVLDGGLGFLYFHAPGNTGSRRVIPRLLLYPTAMPPKFPYVLAESEELSLITNGLPDGLRSMSLLGGAGLVGAVMVESPMVPLGKVVVGVEDILQCRVGEEGKVNGWNVERARVGEVGLVSFVRRLKTRVESAVKRSNISA
ncbi:hypothetical protein BJ742DRAFT_817806 [Cladochytrium replicatum]|nr:hypothetical protein BJ742DRAFT_817806 [Cladochytrium replicatum]